VKKIVLLVAVCIALASVPVFAQETVSSPYYYVNVPIQRIYPYRKGYVVTYRKGAIGSATTYLPIEWFEDDNRGGDSADSASAGAPPLGEMLLLGPGTQWPYLAVYYKDGEFSHVRLYVRKERSHETWGDIQAGVNLDDRFEGVDTIKLEF
jgi:hypothetical protein